MPDPFPDPVQAVGRLHLVGGRAQQSSECYLAIVHHLAHASRSSVVRSAAMARAVWLLTAPLLICMALAI